MMVELKLTKEQKKEVRKKRWKTWKEAPWFQWSSQPFDEIECSKKHFIPMTWHFKAGQWGTVGMYPFYKGNLAKILDFFKWDLGWKDKFRTPRYEDPPMVAITFFWKWRLYFWYGFSKQQHEQGYKEDEYWEQMLWTEYYCDGNVDVARKRWGWKDMAGNSTWKDKYLK